jgi:hypothetical protein
MTTLSRSAIVTLLATLAACTSPATGGGVATGGAGGQPAGTGGSGTSTGGVVGAGTGGSTASGGASGGGGEATGGAAVDASAPPASDASSSGGSTTPSSDGGGGPAVSGDMLAWYECEADGNMFTAPARVTECSAGPCPAGAPIKEALECCSGGKKVSNVERGNGKLLMNKVNAPADGTYDVAWWYHCGKNDNFGDPGCGGDPTKTASGCRPHVIEVNGTRLPKVYEFHCYPGSWGELHVSTVPMTLKAGDNSILIYATPGRDAADLDAIALYPQGKGPMPAAFGH